MDAGRGGALWHTRDARAQRAVLRAMLTRLSRHEEAGNDVAEAENNTTHPGVPARLGAQPHGRVAAGGGVDAASSRTGTRTEPARSFWAAPRMQATAAPSPRSCQGKQPTKRRARVPSPRPRELVWPPIGSVGHFRLLGRSSAASSPDHLHGLGDEAAHSIEGHFDGEGDRRGLGPQEAGQVTGRCLLRGSNCSARTDDDKQFCALRLCRELRQRGVC